MSGHVLAHLLLMLKLRWIPRRGLISILLEVSIDKNSSWIGPHSQSEELFVQYLASGMSPRESYLKAFPTNKPGYANMMAGKLVKTERIKTAMKEELKPVLQELGIDETYILKGIKNTVELADKEDVKLRALFKLADIMDMEDKNSSKITQLTGAVFQGFTDNMIEGAERPAEITDKAT